MRLETGVMHEILSIEMKLIRDASELSETLGCSTLSWLNQRGVQPLLELKQAQLYAFRQGC